MAKIMLIRDFGSHFVPSLHLGLGILGTILKNSGHDVKLLDNNSFYTRYTHKQIVSAIKKSSPEVIGLSINTLNAKVTYDLIAEIKRQGIETPIVAGGLHMRTDSKEGLDHKVDVVVVGEGEPAIVSLIEVISKYWNDREKFYIALKNIPNLSYYDQYGQYINPKFKTLVFQEVMDDIPYIDYDLFNLEDYLKVEGDSLFMGQIITQRGCPYPCNFCSDPYLIRGMRNNSVEYVINYLEMLNQKYGVKVVFFQNENFTLNRHQTIDLCNAIVSSGLNKKINFNIQTNVRASMDREIAQHLKKANIINVALGIERMTEEGKRKINKYVSDTKIRDCVKMLKEEGLLVRTNILVGFPFETKEMILEEKKLFLEIADIVDHYNVNILLPMPGFDLYDNYPKIHRWFLEEEFFYAYNTYFSQVFNLRFGEEMLDRNPYNLSEETINAIRETVSFFSKKGYFDFTKGFDKRNFLLFCQLIDLMIACLSFATFKINKKLENLLFSKLKEMRFLLGVKVTQKHFNQLADPMT